MVLGGVVIYPSTPIVAIRIESPTDLSTLVRDVLVRDVPAPEGRTGVRTH